MVFTKLQELTLTAVDGPDTPVTEIPKNYSGCASCAEGFLLDKSLDNSGCLDCFLWMELSCYALCVWKGNTTSLSPFLCEIRLGHLLWKLLEIRCCRRLDDWTGSLAEFSLFTTIMSKSYDNWIGVSQVF